jgi:transposase-like protein
MNNPTTAAPLSEAAIAPRVSKPRRRFASEFRAKVIRSARQPGVTIAAAARSHDLDPNLVRRWVRTDDRKRQLETHARAARLATGVAAQRTTAGDAASHLRALAAQRAAAFVPVAMNAVNAVNAPNTSTAGDNIRIEFNRGSTTITVAWPLSAARDCGAWLRELMQ